MNINKKILFLIVLGALAMPLVSLGQISHGLEPMTIEDFIYSLEWAIWVIFAFIVLVCFVIAGIFFLTAMGDPAKLKIAKSALIWGIAGVVVGIVAYSILWIIGGVLTTY
ncbi:MAG: hypothetical protein WC711_02675 [Candidatus Staskawiczbacteria bacterium]|jgi:hypothetical protein